MKKTTSRFGALAIWIGWIALRSVFAQDKTTELEDKVKGLEEQLATMTSDVNKLKQVKISGYVQARFEMHSDSKFGLNSKAGGASDDSVANKDYFYIRRGRLKVTYQATELSNYVIYFDASKASVSLKEAYLEFTDPWIRQFTLRVGQQPWFFGDEIERSSSVREMTERSLMENALFNGERDRGVRLSFRPDKGMLSHFTLDLGIWNGYGINDSRFKFSTPERDWDKMAKIHANFGMLKGGVSIYDGTTFVPFQSKTNPTNPSVPPPGGNVGKKKRLGFDLEGFFDLLPIGASGLRFEYITAEDPKLDTTVPNTIDQYKESGFYILAVQNIFIKNQLAIRLDQYDPNTDNEDVKENARTTQLGIAWIHHWDENVRLTLHWNRPVRAIAEVPDNTFTFQFQYKY